MFPMTSDQLPPPDPAHIVSQVATFEIWQVQLLLACEADRREDIDAIASLRAPQHVVLRQITVVRSEPTVRIGAGGMLLSGGGRRTLYRDELIPYSAAQEREECPPLPDLPGPGTLAADELLWRLLREPYRFSGSSLFWVQTLTALRLLEDRGASTHDRGWMDVPLVVFMADRGHADIVRFLVEERGHDPNSARLNGNYTPLHWAKGLDQVRFLVEQGGDPNALTDFGDSVLAQQLRSRQADVVDYLLGLGEARASRAQLLHWLDATPEMLRTLCRHDIALHEPIPSTFGEPYSTLALHRVLRSGIAAWCQAKRTEDKAAAATSLVDCVDILLEHGFDPSRRDGSGLLPFHVLVDNLPHPEEPLRQRLDARLAQYDGPRKRSPRRRA